MKENHFLQAEVAQVKDRLDRLIERVHVYSVHPAHQQSLTLYSHILTANESAMFHEHGCQIELDAEQLGSIIHCPTGTRLVSTARHPRVYILVFPDRARGLVWCFEDDRIFLLSRLGQRSEEVLPPARCTQMQISQ